MKIDETADSIKKFPIRYIIYSIVALILSLVQIQFIDLIAIEGIKPDLLLILCVWIALAEGQFLGLFWAFGIGLLFDMVSADVPGTNALAKVVAAFVAGYFFKPTNLKNNLSTFRFVLISLLSAFVHNIIYFLIYIKPGELDFVTFFLRYGIAATFYTDVISTLAILVRIPQKEIDID